VNGTVSPNIRLANPSLSFYTVIGGASANSTVTLTGIISSIPGQATGIDFGVGSDNTSTINLVGNNTFTGNIFLFGGSLGINSNASLGNAANTLILASGTPGGQFGSGILTAGGLVFLNGGVNLAQQVQLYGQRPTQIVSNGANVNTISGVISDYFPNAFGVSALYKAGSGTLILTGMNTYAGGAEIDAGTLSVGVDANLGAALTPVTNPEHAEHLFRRHRGAAGHTHGRNG
jgi:autotransporter-associated beta strand protein